MGAAKRVCDPVLEEIRPSAGVLSVARRPVSAAVPGANNNPSRGVTPSEPLSGALPLFSWWTPLSIPALRLSLRDGLPSRGVHP